MPCCEVASGPLIQSEPPYLHAASDAESLAQIYDRLQQMTQALPVAGNQDGSYLTAFSSGGLQ